MAKEELRNRIDTIEKAYEFMLSYAAQGMPGDKQSKSGGSLRTYLEQLEASLDGLADLFRGCVDADTPGAAQLAAYIDVLDGDAKSSLATVRLVAAQASISSQLIDNFNASIHVRALLTDLFLIDEILGLPKAPNPESPEPS